MRGLALIAHFGIHSGYFHLRYKGAQYFLFVKVICVGLPRTGTLSLKAALTELLGGRCYHGFDNLFGGQVAIMEIIYLLLFCN